MNIKRNEAIIYLTLKYIEQEEEPEFRELGTSKKAFYAALEEIHKADWATNITFKRGGLLNRIKLAVVTGSRLTQSGRYFITDFERKVSSEDSHPNI
ncbi:hypothetical protein QW71_11935 [Paenibacillus sp. IHB B 3415]|uniref:hypothetical protein n=1 Tax=Paenibacillus sp. IHB B 3415 TaxID=867080 RepID=UPI0005730FA9|nr:hypothetical protein [Paenibacillus sp. IHB B 3415]KHL95428.1 hypothetical protein QW71_11935 [Paenibacillus sp. IHB B 3415]